MDNNVMRVLSNACSPKRFHEQIDYAEEAMTNMRANGTINHRTNDSCSGRGFTWAGVRVPRRRTRWRVRPL